MGIPQNTGAHINTCNHISTSTKSISIFNTATMSIPWMHGCDVIVGNWDEDLGRGRRMQRGCGWVKAPAEQRTDSLTELCEFANMAYDALEAAERKPALLEWLETSAASPEDSAPISGASQTSPSEHRGETPPTEYSIPEHHEPGMGYAGWKEFSGRSRAPSPWVGGRWVDQPATPGRVRRSVRKVKDCYKAFKFGRAISQAGQVMREIRRSVLSKK